MSVDVVLPSPSPIDVSLMQQVQQNWNQGNQEVALSLLRPRAEEGEGWVASVLSWLLMQQGYPALEESINWALAAAREGFAAQLTSTFNTVVGHLPSYPQLAHRVPELLRLGLPWHNGFDPIGQGWTFVQNGQAELGTQMIMMPTPVPHSLAEPQMSLILDQARDRVEELRSIAKSAREHQATVEETSQNAQARIEKARDDLETSARQAGLLVTAVTSDATDARFVADALRNSKESKAAWRFGLLVLGGAATVAVLPVVLHYLAIGPDYSSFEQIALHLVSTAALASFAGVLLARGRARDHAAQRANDLSTAMGTMIAYSNQISDDQERQRFMTVMGQAVLQAHLASGSKQSGDDDSLAKMIALASLVRPASVSSAASPG